MIKTFEAECRGCYFNAGMDGQTYASLKTGKKGVADAESEGW